MVDMENVIHYINTAIDLLKFEQENYTTDDPMEQRSALKYIKIGQSLDHLKAALKKLEGEF